MSSTTWKPLNRREACVFEGDLGEQQLTEVRTGLKGRVKHDQDGALVLWKEIGQDKEGVLIISKVRSQDLHVLEQHKINVGKISPPLWVQTIGAWEEKETLRKIVYSLTWKSTGLAEF